MCNSLHGESAMRVTHLGSLKPSQYQEWQLVLGKALSSPSRAPSSSRPPATWAFRQGQALFPASLKILCTPGFPCCLCCSGRPLTFLNPSLLLCTVGMITPGLLSIVNTKLQIHGAYQGLKDHSFLFPWDSFLPLLLPVVQSIFS